MPAFRFKCKKCHTEFHRHYSQDEFDKNQYSGGFGCFECGFPKMAVMKSNQRVKDGFQPGFQRNIGKYCSTYSEYKAHLKAMGLIEIGYEELPHDENGNVTNYWDDPAIKKKLASMGFSDREIDAASSREIF